VMRKIREDFEMCESGQSTSKSGRMQQGRKR
jgi:hypothetical protein